MATRKALSSCRTARASLLPSNRIQWQHMRAFSATRPTCDGDVANETLGAGSSAPLPEPLPFPLDEATFKQVRTSLMSRKLPALYDFVASTPSHSLDVTLSDFLPFVKTSYPSGLPGCCPTFSKHLVYFPPQDPLSQLLPDQTDPAQSPGSPFDRRMWAGGRITQLDCVEAKSPFGRISGNTENQLKESMALCIERIADVKLKGDGDSQKIFVTLERRIGSVPAPAGQSSPAEERGWLLNNMSNCGVIELRHLVFMPTKKGSQDGAKSDGAIQKERPKPKVVRAPHAADFSVTLTPTQDLLFRFSALTFNAHRIHLDKSYCRDVEGHRNLLVHGPMSCVMMCEVLGKHLEDRFYEAVKDQSDHTEADKSSTRKSSTQGFRIVDFTYRNLAPLYAEEPLTVCVRRKPQDLVIDQNKWGENIDLSKLNEWPPGSGKLAEVDQIYSDAKTEGVIPAPKLRYAQFDCWVENKDGSMCVRGTAICQIQSHEDRLSAPYKANY